MRFIYDAPGYLIPDGSGGFTAKWTVASDNVGFSQAAVEAQISEALNDSRGWGQLGINYEQVSFPSPDPYTVVFKTVASTTSVGSPEWSWAVTVWKDYFGPGNPPNTQILIEAAHFADLGIPNHEAAHAYFGATHSPEGSDSLMEPMEDPGSEWPSDTDIAQVEQWLGTSADPRPSGETFGALEGGRYWFPGNLPYYITRWPVPAGSEARLTANVLRRTRGTLQALCSDDYDELLADNGRRLSAGIDLWHEGFFASPWRECPAGELYVGILADVENGDVLTDLVVGHAKVQIRGGTGSAPTVVCAPEDTITLGLDAPGRLTVEDGQLYGDYQIAPDNFGYTEAEARERVAAALGNASGWSRAGITFRETVDAPVTFRFVHGPFLCSGVTANGCTTPSGDSAVVEISYERSEAGYTRNLINHESGHAYFGASHTGKGIMTGDSVRGFPNDCDIKSVTDWLGI